MEEETNMEIEKLLELIWMNRLGMVADLAIGLGMVVFGLLCLMSWVKHIVERV